MTEFGASLAFGGRVIASIRTARGRSGVTNLAPASLNAKQTEALGTFLAVCRDRLPPEPDKPPRTEIEQEIGELEYRLEHLRQSIGAAQPAARE